MGRRMILHASCEAASRIGVGMSTVTTRIGQTGACIPVRE